MTKSSKLCVGLLLLSVFISCPGCYSTSIEKSYPPELAKHWVSKSHPESLGLLLKKGGDGYLDGTNKGYPGPPIKWYVSSEKLYIRIFGEEGEHGQFEPFEYQISNDRLKIVPPIHRETEYVLHR